MSFDIINRGTLRAPTVQMTIPTIRSRQVPGKGIGTKEIVPTINLEVPVSLELPHGVYAARVILQCPDDAKILPAAVHYGPRPTIQDLTPSLEVHVLDTKDIPVGYDAEDVCVEIVAFVRSVRTFHHPAALRAQITADIENVRTLLHNT